MKPRRLIVSSLFVCSGLLFSAAAVRAADEGGAGASAAPTELFKWINFAIVASALIWLFAKVLPPMFQGQAEKISSAITRAQAAKAEADRKLRDAEQRLARLEEEVRGLREQAQKEAAAEAERLRAMAKSDAEKIAVSAKAEIEAAERAARIELKALAAKLAVDSAESLLAKQLPPQTQDALIAGFVKSLQGSAN
ncbi:MAG TPA: ATP synthase F0 subunit B [Candidatus Bathyarchaeia archaeon]|nr:ATP synthase F0 subunit B [Candidatus Bathyarchaeia archaeon]